jgi:hypothetical protein
MVPAGLSTSQRYRSVPVPAPVPQPGTAAPAIVAYEQAQALLASIIAELGQVHAENGGLR